MPHFFSQKERSYRSSLFSNILHTNNIVLVHSNTVKKHLVKYFSPFKASIYVLPLAPIPESWFFSCPRTTLVESLSSTPYFLVCNQFWKHKDHETVIRALSKVISSSSFKPRLICTGNTYDHRFPQHFVYLKNLINSLGLNEYITFTGFLSKQEQISLLLGCSAVIQPSLFEGTPGGGIAYEAMSVGVDLFLSSTDVNLELSSYRHSRFFAPSNHDELAELLLRRLQEPHRTIDPNDCILRAKESAARFSSLITDAAYQATLSHH